MDEMDLQPLAFSNEPEFSKKEKEERAARKRKRKAKAPVNKQPKRPRVRRAGNISWCLCGRCIPMDTERKSVCCMENFSSGSPQNKFGRPTCVTEERDFEASILNRTTLKISWVQKSMLRCARDLDQDLAK